MKAAKNDIVIFIICLVIGGLFPLVIFGKEFYFKVDAIVQLHDTYYIFRPYEFAIITIGLTLLNVFFFRAIWTGFKNKLTLIFLALGIIALGLALLKIYRMINS